MIDETMIALIHENARLAAEARRLWCSIPVVRKLNAQDAEITQLRAELREAIADMMRMEQRMQGLEFPERTQAEAEQAADDFMAEEGDDV